LEIVSPKFINYCPILLGTERKKFSIMVDDAIVAICLVIPQRMRLSGTVMEIWPFEVLPGRLFQEQRSVVGHRSSVGRSSILH